MKALREEETSPRSPKPLLPAEPSLLPPVPDGATATVGRETWQSIGRHVTLLSLFFFFLKWDSPAAHQITGRQPVFVLNRGAEWPRRDDILPPPP